MISSNWRKKAVCIPIHYHTNNPESVLPGVAVTLLHGDPGTRRRGYKQTRVFNSEQTEETQEHRSGHLYTSVDINNNPQETWEASREHGGGRCPPGRCPFRDSGCHGGSGDSGGHGGSGDSGGHGGSGDSGGHGGSGDSGGHGGSGDLGGHGGSGDSGGWAQVSWAGPAEAKVSWTGPAEAKVSWMGPVEARVNWTGPAEAKVSWTGPTLGGALEALTLVGALVALTLVGARAVLTLVGARAALTLVGGLESWKEPSATKMSWAGPAEELESTCEESAPEGAGEE